MKIDYLIVGQGLAGSILAWELMLHEQRVLVLDSGRENSASRVAAGLINPVTGQRLVKSVDVDVCLPVALDYYRKLEQHFGQQFYYSMPMLRLFHSRQDEDRYRQRSDDARYQNFLGKHFLPGESGESINDCYGGFEQQQTGYLNISSLMEAIREWLEQHESYLETSFDYTELRFHGDGVQWRDFQAKNVIFCEGASALDNPWFRWLPFQLCKGDIISLRSDNALPNKIINDGHWLLPMDGHTAKVGATYDWQWRSEEPCASSKQILLEAFNRLTGIVQDTTLDHRSGIRPTTRDKHPFVGFHPVQKQLVIFNGFGSKGALLIPYLALQFTETLLGNKALPSDVDIDRFEHGNSLVTLAKRLVSESINPGDVVVDATVGNGYDTEFLARCVGAEGHVYGFDIQQQSIANTQARLLGFGLESRVTLFHAGHESMAEHIEDRLHGKIAAMMFNLGYLPGGDKSIQTQTDSTLYALKQAVTLLRADGVITIITYSGHAGGDYETREVSNWLKQPVNESIHVEFVSPGKNTANAPGLIKIIKKYCDH